MNLCGPHEWAEITEASLTPERLTIADFDLRVRVRVTLDRCSDAPAPHEVEVTALINTSPGDAGGVPVTIMTLLTVEDGDADGMIDTEVINPFLATFPANEDIVLRFLARSSNLAGCTSGSIEVPYRTGPPRL